MTPKEKAKELVNQIYQPLGMLRCGVSSNEMWEYAKQCALIAVDEIINEPAYADSGSTYWQQVKQEISNL